MSAFQYVAVGTFGFVCFIIGWCVRGRSMRRKLGVINDKVEAGKLKVQKAVNDNK